MSIKTPLYTLLYSTVYFIHAVLYCTVPGSATVLQYSTTGYRNRHDHDDDTMDKKQRMRALLQAYEKNFGMKPRNMRDLVLRLKDPRAWEAQETEAVRGAPGDYIVNGCRRAERHEDRDSHGSRFRILVDTAERAGPGLAFHQLETPAKVLELALSHAQRYYDQTKQPNADDFSIPLSLIFDVLLRAMSDVCVSNSHTQHFAYKQAISRVLAGDGALDTVVPLLSRIIHDPAASGAFPYNLCVCVVHFYKLCEAIFPVNSYGRHIVNDSNQIRHIVNDLVCAIVQVGLAVVEPRAIHPSWKASMDIFMEERAAAAAAGGAAPHLSVDTALREDSSQMDLSNSLDQQDFSQIEAQMQAQSQYNPQQPQLKVNSSQAAEFLQQQTGLPFTREGARKAAQLANPFATPMQSGANIDPDVVRKALSQHGRNLLQVVLAGGTPSMAMGAPGITQNQFGSPARDSFMRPGNAFGGAGGAAFGGGYNNMAWQSQSQQQQQQHGGNDNHRWPRVCCQCHCAKQRHEYGKKQWKRAKRGKGICTNCLTFRG